jgi:hypothetical protein
MSLVNKVKSRNRLFAIQCFIFLGKAKKWPKWAQKYETKLYIMKWLILEHIVLKQVAIVKVRSMGTR